jgi:hypothetical protein
MVAEHIIYIRPEAFGAGFDITVEPPAPWADFNRERPTLKAARRYAGSLRTVHGWRVKDETGGAA